MNKKSAPQRISSQARLMEIFNTELLKNGNDPFSAFIATLDELDQRQQWTNTGFSEVGEKFRTLAKWTRQVDKTLEELPGEFEAAALDARGPLEGAASTGAAKGVQTGLGGLERTVEALRATQWALEDTKASVRRGKRLTVPLTVFFVVAGLWFFNNAIIPVLPPTLEWPCKITGLDYGRSGEGLDRFSYCVIAR